MLDPSRPFVIDVADLVQDLGSQRREPVSGLVDFGALQTHVVRDRPLVADLLLESLRDGILVTGEARFVVRHACNRCLREWEESGSVEVAQLYGRHPDDDGYQIGEDDLVDVEQLLRDEVTLSFPLAPLCREDCRGLCPTCGADLNEDPCSGHPEESDSPFAVLKELFAE